MIGIIITEDIKVQNELSNSVGSIMTRGNYPKKWWGSERVDFGYKHRTDLHEVDGWADVVSATYDTATQKIGALYFDEDNNIFTYYVIDLTQEEIDELAEQTDENDAREKIDGYTIRGAKIIEKVRTKMWRRVHKNPEGPNGLTKQQVAKLERWFWPAYSNLLFGNFRQAKNEMNNVIEERDDVTGDSSLLEVAGMLDTAIWLRDEVTDYFDNKYDL